MMSDLSQLPRPEHHRCVLKAAIPSEQSAFEDIDAGILGLVERAEGDEDEALYVLWEMLQQGVIVDDSNARRWFRVTAELFGSGSGSEENRSRRCAELTPDDEFEAMEWYREAHSPGVSYEDFTDALSGRATQAVRLREYQRNAENGDVGAMFLLGTECLEGYEVPYNEELAVKWLRKAAENDDTTALSELWRLLDESIPDDTDEAVAWFSMMAEKGDAAVKCQLAEWLHANDWPDAIEWYRKAGEQGDCNAQRTLGDLYFEGDTVQRDWGEACRWYMEAAKQGDADAQFGYWCVYRDEPFQGGGEKAVRCVFRTMMTSRFGPWLPAVSEHGYQ